MFDTPILFIVFNRPEITMRVFQEIKRQKPKTLFLAADGPRENNEEDVLKCRLTREKVLNAIDWNCDVKTLFRNSNLGCGKAVSGAIDWFFENVEMGIILEDDCLPHPDFFRYCECLLYKYKDDVDVYGISGNNFQNKIQRGNSSYFFSKYMFVWGWASWRRAWLNYDFNLTDLDDFKRKDLISLIDGRQIFRNYWYSIFDQVKKEQIDTWDYQWMFSIWNNEGITTIPNVNLVSNIGFGKEATHTTESSPLASLDTYSIGSLKHPGIVKVNLAALKHDTEVVFKILPEKKKIRRLLKALSKKINSRSFLWK